MNQLLIPAAFSVHGLFELLGVAVAVVVLLGGARAQQRLDDAMVTILLGALICGGLAARLSVVWRYVDAAPEPSLRGFLLEGGQSVLGGLAGAYAGVLLTKRLLGYRRGTGDLFAPAVALGIAVGRVGCHLAEPPGRPTGLPWGVHLSTEEAAHFSSFPPEWAGLPLHPSFLYEIAFHLAAASLLLMWRREGRFKDDLLKVYLLGYALFRFAVEFVRANPTLGGLTRSQWFLIPSIALLLTVLARRGYLRTAIAFSRPETRDV